VDNSQQKLCLICGSDKFVDEHHYDCKEGKISPETLLLCRRCHRTYHDLGIEWFDDRYLDKAIAIENKRRQIIYANLKDPQKSLQLLKREDISRSPYWNKIHGLKATSRKPPQETKEAKQLGFAIIDDLMTLQ